MSHYTDISTLVKTKLPNFGYQLQLASGKVEAEIKTKEQIKQFLNALYGGAGPNGEVGFNVKEGTKFENLGKLGRTKLMGDEMLEFYTEEYARNGMGGTREYPALFVHGTNLV